MPTTKSFIVAMKQFFGFKEGQGLVEFKREIDQLTEKDRNDFAEMFAGEGIEIDPATLAIKAAS